LRKQTNDQFVTPEECKPGEKGPGQLCLERETTVPTNELSAPRSPTIAGEDIFDNSITSNDIQDGTIQLSDLSPQFLEKLLGVKKLLFIDCRLKIQYDVPAAHGINYENLNWVTSLPVGLASCTAPGVEGGDSVILGPTYSNAAVIFDLVTAQDDRIGAKFRNYNPTPIYAGDGIYVNAIVFQK
jgi:hypothetical protein